MCMLSVVIDRAAQQWPPPYSSSPATPGVEFYPPVPPVPPYTGPTREQFEELLKLMRAAKEFDKATGQPDCEMEEKKQLIRDMAKHLGVLVEFP